MEQQLFPDIFEKLKDLKPVEKELEFWVRLTDMRFENKVTGEILSDVQFLRYQHTNSYNIILEL
jgi:hypothetical protein